MKSAIDSSGRVVIPKAFREEIGLTPGPIEIVVDGSSIRIEPITSNGLSQVGSRLVIPASNTSLNDDDVLALRRADQR